MYKNVKREEKMEDEIKVSVIMLVYNHENYLKQAIESVIEQKVKFNYELLIGEDKSTDNSLQIIREYERKYPKIIKVFARQENYGAVKNSYDLYIHSKGQYMTHLEGDDYWTDPYRMQKQVDFLEEHTDYIACAHRFRVVDRNGETYYDRDFECQFFQGNPYTKDVFERGLMLSHGNTLLFRNIFLDEKIRTDFWTDFPNVAGDYTLTALLILNGKVYCMPEYMSCYRKVTDKNSSSFSAWQERENNRDFLFKSTIDLEQILKREYEVDCIERKKRIFASAVFKWYRDGGMRNFKVICNTIKMSKEPIKYIKWFFYLICCRFWKNLIGKKSERVNF